jgi:class 3 adenylate cyclase
VSGVGYRFCPERVLATLLFVGLVDSREQASALGDARWRALRDTFYTAVCKGVAHFEGWVAKTAGDGVLVVFEAPTVALRSACAIRDTLAAHGVRTRAGVHTGECAIIGDEVTGIAVHVAAQIAAAAGAGEVFASATVCDLVAGAGIILSDQGLHHLKGVPGKQPLVAVAAVAEHKQLRAASGVTAHPRRSRTATRTAKANVRRRVVGQFTE